MNRAPFVLSDQDERVLRFVAGEMGEEWASTAQELQLNAARIQAIRQMASVPDVNYKYEMLLTWFKMQTKSANKVSALIIIVIN